MYLKGIEGVTIEKACYPSMNAEWIKPEEGEEGKAILYFHGDGCVTGDITSRKGILGNFVKQVGYNTLVFDYRLAPEFSSPSAVLDSAAIYTWMLKSGYHPEDIIFAGDSAGGGIELGTLLKLKDNGIPLPAACIAFSPCLDMSSSSESHLSPLYGNLTGLPPIMIHVGNDEILRDDSTRFGLRADSFNVDVRVKIWEGMPNCFPLLAPRLEETTEAMQQVKTFITQQMNKDNRIAATFLYMMMSPHF